MTELEEVLLDIEQRIQKMSGEQMDRYSKSGQQVGFFLSSDREEAWTKRIQMLIDAKIAIAHILGR